jgi:UDP-N-acetylmuramyl pentapeptide phosphotransferase/UDP-N-acetylglucosamine-1-phosphate transferase
MEYKYNSPIAYMIFFIICLGFSVLINTIFIKFTKTLGIRKNTDQQTIRWESKQKPAIGGISIYIIFLLSLIAFEIIFKQGSELLN